MFKKVTDNKVINIQDNDEQQQVFYGWYDSGLPFLDIEEISTTWCKVTPNKVLKHSSIVANNYNMALTIVASW